MFLLFLRTNSNLFFCRRFNRRDHKLLSCGFRGCSNSRSFPSRQLTRKHVLNTFFNFNNLFLDKGCGHKLTHTNKNEISINLFPVLYYFVLLKISWKSIHPNVLCCAIVLTMGNPINHSEHLFYAGWSWFLFFLRLNYLIWLMIWFLLIALNTLIVFLSVAAFILCFLWIDRKMKSFVQKNDYSP